MATSINLWKIDLEKNKEYLNKIDFIPYLERYDILKDLVYAVEDDYDYTDFTKDDFLQGSIFNSMSNYDIQDYLNERYKDQYELKEPEYYEPPIYIKRINKSNN